MFGDVPRFPSPPGAATGLYCTIQTLPVLLVTSRLCLYLVLLPSLYSPSLTIFTWQGNYLRKEHIVLDMRFMARDEESQHQVPDSHVVLFSSTTSCELVYVCICKTARWSYRLCLSDYHQLILQIRCLLELINSLPALVPKFCIDRIRLYE